MGKRLMTPTEGPLTDSVSRRRFVQWAVGLGTGFIAVAAGIPLVGSVIKTRGRPVAAPFIEIGKVTTFPTGVPTAVAFAETARDAYNISTVARSAYVLKRSDTDVVVFTPVCPHLGCHVSFDATLGAFVCPCHGSRFSATGKRIAGPTPRDLDTLPSKIEKGVLLAQWVQYRPGVAEKTAV